MLNLLVDGLPSSPLKRWFLEMGSAHPKTARDRAEHLHIVFLGQCSCRQVWDERERNSDMLLHPPLISGRQVL